VKTTKSGRAPRRHVHFPSKRGQRLSL
jgi:hypothetical protein